MQLSVVGIGPGSDAYLVPAARQVLADADVVIGYHYYFQFVSHLLKPGCECIGRELSDEEARAEDGGMSYRIVLAAPLKSGRSYTLSVESELGHEITDFSGRGYRDVRVGLRVRGEPEAEPKKKPGKKRHK